MTIRLTALGCAILACTALVLSQPSARAQMPGAHPPAMGQQNGQMQRMAQALNLTPKQQAKIAAIVETQRPAIMALFSNRSLSMAQKMQKMRAMQHGMQAKLNAVLTPVQRKKVAAMEARAQMAMRKQMAMHGGMGRPGGPPHGQP